MDGRFLNEKTRQQRKMQRTATTVAVRLAIGLILAAVILVNLFTHVFQIVRYNGDGMEPSLRDGQTLFLRKTQDVEMGDIIAFYYNNQILVRRVISTGNEQIIIENDGSVYVGSQLLEETYVSQKSMGQCNITFPYYVQKNYVFVMGDNRAVAMDSRLEEIGTVSKDRIIGKVIFAV